MKSYEFFHYARGNRSVNPKVGRFFIKKLQGRGAHLGLPADVVFLAIPHVVPLLLFYRELGGRRLVHVVEPQSHGDLPPDLARLVLVLLGRRLHHFPLHLLLSHVREQFCSLREQKHVFLRQIYPGRILLILVGGIIVSRKNCTLYTIEISSNNIIEIIKFPVLY